MYKLPFDCADVIAIGNVVNHAREAPPGIGPAEYIRTGPYCIVGNGNDAMETYWHGKDYAHDGTDLYMLVGTPIFAMADGEVLGAYESTTAGLRIDLRQIDWRGKWYSSDLHLSRAFVSSHDPVIAGQMIGLSGATGICGSVMTDFGEVGHLHKSIGSRPGSGDIDPLIDPRFQGILHGIPFEPRSGATPGRYLTWHVSAGGITRINGRFRATTRRLEDAIYEFDLPSGTQHLVHFGKAVNDKYEPVTAFDLLPSHPVKIQDNGRYILTVRIRQLAAPGIYYFQAIPASNPVSIEVLPIIDLF